MFGHARVISAVLCSFFHLVNIALNNNSKYERTHGKTSLMHNFYIFILTKTFVLKQLKYSADSEMLPHTMIHVIQHLSNCIPFPKFVKNCHPCQCLYFENK